MKRTFLLLTCISTMMLTACTSDTSLPTPTGKGVVRAINAIPGSPEVSFLIEERFLAGVPYKNSSTPVEYDDFNYNFNFEIAHPGDTAFTRVATEAVKVDADRDHILLISGDINMPTVTVIDGDIRTFDGSETVFEARFLNAAASLGNVDVYFEPPGTLPGTNPPTATLAFGEIANAADFAEGSYVITVTAENDVNTVHFTSGEASLLPQFAHVISLFDGDANDTAPLLVRSMTTVGNSLTFVDADHPPQIRFIHGASTLEIVDVYDDDVLTNRVVAGLDFKGTTAYFDATIEAKTYYFTPANSTAVILFERALPAPVPGRFSNIYAIGDTDAWSAPGLIADLAPTSISFRILLFHAALNHATFDAYILDRDVPLGEDDSPILLAAAYGTAAPIINIAAGNVDLYLTVRAEKTVIAGPFQIDATLGTQIELVLVDTVDPLTAELIDITTP